MALTICSAACADDAADTGALAIPSLFILVTSLLLSGASFRRRHHGHQGSFESFMVVLQPEERSAIGGYRGFRENGASNRGMIGLLGMLRKLETGRGTAGDWALISSQVWRYPGLRSFYLSDAAYDARRGHPGLLAIPLYHGTVSVIARHWAKRPRAVRPMARRASPFRRTCHLADEQHAAAYAARNEALRFSRNKSRHSASRLSRWLSSAALVKSGFAERRQHDRHAEIRQRGTVVAMQGILDAVVKQNTFPI